MKIKSNDYSYNRKLQYIIEQCGLQGQMPLKDSELSKICYRDSDTDERRNLPKTSVTAWRKNYNPLSKTDYYLIFNSLLPWIEDQLNKANKRIETLIDLHKSIVTLMHNQI